MRPDLGTGVGPKRSPLRRTSGSAVLPGDPFYLTLFSLLVLVLIFICKVMLFRNLEYYGSDMYSFLRMTWSWFHDGVLLYDNVYGYHAAIHSFYILILFFPLTSLFGAHGLFLGLFLVAGLAIVAVSLLTELPLSSRLVMAAGLLSPIGFWILDHPQWGFHPELLYPYLGVILTVGLVKERRVTVIAAAVAICLVKEDGAAACASILLATFTARMLLMRHEPPCRRLLLQRAAVGIAVCVAVFAAGIATLHAVRYLIPNDGDQLWSTVRIGEALLILTSTLEGTGNPEWSERLRTGLSHYALIALSLGFLLGRRVFAYLVVALIGAAPVVVVLAVSTAPYGFGNLFWPPRVATLLAPLYGALVAVSWASRPERSLKNQDSPPAGFRPTFAVPLVLIAASWSLQLFVLRTAADYSIRSRLDLPALISGTGSRASTLRPEELRFARCLAAELPDRFRISSQGPQSPVFHRQDLSFPGIESRAKSPPEIRITIGMSSDDPQFKDGFRFTIGRLAASGRNEAEHWLERCVAGGTSSITVPRAPSQTQQ
jgi:hypothetical protein